MIELPLAVQNTWTLALWVKKQGNDCHIFGAGDVSTDRFGFGFNGSDKIFAFVIDSNSTVFRLQQMLSSVIMVGITLSLWQIQQMELKQIDLKFM